MKFKNKYKLVATIFILIFSLFLTSCASIGFGSTMPTLEIFNEFENDKWIVVDKILVNKTEGKACFLHPNPSVPAERTADISYQSTYTYKIEFEETAFKLYTFAQTYYFPENSEESVDAFFECVFTYNYEGYEIDRVYLSEALTPQQAMALYATKANKTEVFTFEVSYWWEDYKEDYEYASTTEKEILEHIENGYNDAKDSIDTVVGTAKTIGNEVWFSVVVSPNGAFNSGHPLLDGIHESGIKSYNPDSGEIKVVFEYSEKNEAIIDFDEKGLYTFDNRGNLKYFDMESRTSTLIHNFPGMVYSFQITNNYITTNYEDNEKGYYFFVYEKGKNIVANNLYSKYDLV